MSLTAEALREREWGPYPTLRKALEDKQIPHNYYGCTSADDNMFNAMSRLIKIAVLAAEYEGEIRKIAGSDCRDEMCLDLRKLEEALEQSSWFFNNARDKVRSLYVAL